MKFISFIINVALSSLARSVAGGHQPSRIEAIMEMISALQSKVVSEGADAQKLFDEYSQWCEDRSTELDTQIKAAETEEAELTASIKETSATIASFEGKVKELSADVEKYGADLKVAATVRAKNSAAFAMDQKDLTGIISMLERATAVLSKDGKLSNESSVSEVLGVMLKASMLSSADASQLTALSLTSQECTANSSLIFATDVVPKEGQGHDDSIMDTFKDMMEKTHAKLQRARKAEIVLAKDYKSLQQFTMQQTTLAKEGIERTRKANLKMYDGAARARSDLAETVTGLKADISSKEEVDRDCMGASGEYDSASSSRRDEMRVLSATRKLIAQTTGGAAAETYGFSQTAYLGAERIRRVVRFESVRFLGDLAEKSKSSALAHLALRMSSAIRLSLASSEDPFLKVKSLIVDFMGSLEAKAKADAAQKSFCDGESMVTSKRSKLRAESSARATKLNQAKDASAKLKEHVVALQEELVKMAKSKTVADAHHVSDKKDNELNVSDMEMGLEGVRKALKSLEAYYGKEDRSSVDAEGGGTSIIILLEGCKADFAKALAEMIAEELKSVDDRKAYVEDYETSRAAKDRDVQSKITQVAKLDKLVEDLPTGTLPSMTELDSAQADLDMIRENIKQRCAAEAQQYKDRGAARESELVGLKQALELLEDEAGLLSKSAKRASTLRR